MVNLYAFVHEADFVKYVNSKDLTNTGNSKVILEFLRDVGTYGLCTSLKNVPSAHLYWPVPPNIGASIRFRS